MSIAPVETIALYEMIHVRNVADLEHAEDPKQMIVDKVVSIQSNIRGDTHERHVHVLFCLYPLNTSHCALGFLARTQKDPSHPGKNPVPVPQMMPSPTLSHRMSIDKAQELLNSFPQTDISVVRQPAGVHVDLTDPDVEYLLDRRTFSCD